MVTGCDFLKKYSWVIVLVLLFTTYYLSSIPGLRVLPVLKQVNALLHRINLGFSEIAQSLAARIPEELAPAKTLTGDFLNYATENPVVIEFLLRKIAHVGLFFIITVAIFLLLRYYIKSPRVAVIATFLIAAAIASLDEYHQSFVDGRTGSVIDVAINLFGVTLAILLVISSYFLASVHYRKEEAGQ